MFALERIPLNGIETHMPNTLTSFGRSSFRSFKVIRSLLIALLFVCALSASGLASAGYSATWQAVTTTDLPAWRSWSAMTWASGMNRIVLWGGWGATFINDMYSLDPVALDWQTIEPGSTCPGNIGFDEPNGSDESGVVYDPVNDRLWIMIGGSGYRCVGNRTASIGTTTTSIVDTTLEGTTVDYYKDFYVNDLTNYATVTAYNPATHTLSLSNALSLTSGSAYQLFADTGAGAWSYDFSTSTYSKLEARHWGYAGPVPTGSRLSPGFASNGSSYAILFGGVGSYNWTYYAYDNSTWKLDFATQTYVRMIQMGASTGPAARAQIENQFVYDSLHDRFILFGGRCRDPDNCGFAGNRLNDTWVYDPGANTWTQVFPATSPPSRDQAQMYFDAAHGVTVLYGGADINGTALGDTWIFDLAAQTWTQLTPTGTPIPLNLAMVAFAPTTGCGYIALGETTDGAASHNVYQICLTSSGGGNISPVANIAATPTSGSISTVFSFYGGASSDADGTITSYAWNFGDGSSATGATVTKKYSAAGTYTVTLTVTDNVGATGSKPTPIPVSAGGASSVNVALASNGAIASASSTYGSNFPVAAAINGDRKGLNWGAGGGWNDATTNAYPDWLQVTFAASQTIGEIDVFTLQDSFQSPVTPTTSTTFSLYGITAFEVQYWNGSAWTDVPNGNVTGNNLVWRKFAFSPITTNSIRILVNGALNTYSRIVEVVAWTATSGTNIAPTVTLTSPANAATFTAPATVSLAATASDSDGTVAKVEFYRGSTLVGTATSSPYTAADPGLAAGTYTYTAIAYDNAGATTTSAAATVTVTAGGASSINVALASSGASASASTTYSSSYPAASAINGDRQGLNWGSGGGWNDATTNAYPDWLQITFASSQTIGEIDVFTLQDSFQSPVTPTTSTTFSLYGITAFEVQYWNGSAWTDVPNGNVTGNNLVWRKFAFSPITTNSIRILVNGALNTYSRIVEVEAWTN